jgi:hypothetical protein
MDGPEDEMAAIQVDANDLNHNGTAPLVVNRVTPKTQARTYIRDALSRIEQVTDAKADITRFNYGSFGNLSLTITPQGNIIKVE